MMSSVIRLRRRRAVIVGVMVLIAAVHVFRLGSYLRQTDPNRWMRRIGGMAVLLWVKRSGGDNVGPRMGKMLETGLDQARAP